MAGPSDFEMLSAVIIVAIGSVALVCTILGWLRLPEPDDEGRA